MINDARGYSCATSLHCAAACAGFHCPRQLVQVRSGNNEASVCGPSVDVLLVQIVRYHAGEKYEPHHDLFDICDFPQARQQLGAVRCDASRPFAKFVACESCKAL
eukprot:6205031-Pleurochrysis_carterae.AAC.2